MLHPWDLRGAGARIRRYRLRVCSCGVVSVLDDVRRPNGVFVIHDGLGIFEVATRKADDLRSSKHGVSEQVASTYRVMTWRMLGDAGIAVA